MANPQVIVEFLAKTADLKKGMAEAEGASSSAGSKLKSMGRTALAVAGAAGLGALVATLKIGVDEFTQAAKVSAQTEAAIKATGGAAHVSAKHVEDLAHSLMEKSGIDDEVIQSGENLLLTFRNIRNESGKGNKIFDQTTRIMLDMSVALGQDMKSSAIQLGKALNDPIKGITALQRVGVSFTQAQKDQIKALEESGHHMEAQKLILQELNKEFGGSAEAAGKTLPGELNILKENFRNLAGSIVQVVVPAIKVVADLFAQNPGLARAVTIGLLALAAAVVAMNVALTVTAVVASPVALIFLGIVAAVAALAAVAYLLYKNWDAVQHGLEAAWNAIKAGAAAVIDWLKDHWPLIVGILLGPFGLIVAEIIKNWKAIKDAVVGGVNAVIDFINGAFNSVFQAGWNMANGIVNGVLAALQGIGWAAWGILNNIIEVITSQASNIYNWGWGAARNIWDGMLAALNGIGGAVWGVIAGIGSTIWNSLSTVYQWGWNIGRKIWDGIMGGLKGIANWIIGAIKAPINAVISAWNNLKIGGFTIKLPGPIPDVHFGGIDLPNLPYLAAGGIVTRPTLAMIGESGPEAVVPLSSGGPAVQVHVFIGDTELRGMVRTEVVTENNRVAQTLLAGLA